MTRTSKKGPEFLETPIGSLLPLTWWRLRPGPSRPTGVEARVPQGLNIYIYLSISVTSLYYDPYVCVCIYIYIYNIYIYMHIIITHICIHMCVHICVYIP